MSKNVDNPPEGGVTHAESLQEALVEVYQIIQLSDVQLSFSRVEGGEELLADTVYTLQDWTHDVGYFSYLALTLATRSLVFLSTLVFTTRKFPYCTSSKVMKTKDPSPGLG